MPIAVPLLVMAVPLLIAGVWIALWGAQRRATAAAREAPAGWVRAPGVVIDEIAGRERIGRSLEYHSAHLRQPIVRYQPAIGAETTFRSPLRATAMPRPGDMVTVVHDPRDPTQARIAPESIPAITRRMSTVTAVVMVVIGLPLLAAFEGIGVFLLLSR